MTDLNPKLRELIERAQRGPTLTPGRNRRIAAAIERRLGEVERPPARRAPRLAAAFTLTGIFVSAVAIAASSGGWLHSGASRSASSLGALAPKSPRTSTFRASASRSVLPVHEPDMSPAQVDPPATFPTLPSPRAFVSRPVAPGRGRLAPQSARPPRVAQAEAEEIDKAIAVDEADPTAILSPEPPHRPMARAQSDELLTAVRILRVARAAVDAGDPDNALTQVLELARRFPEVLAQERETVRILSLCRLNRACDARAALTVFIDRWPESPLRHRLVSQCGPLTTTCSIGPGQ